MNRREFLATLNPLRILKEIESAPKRAETERNELFLRAMAQGIDPATVDPAQLPELLGEKVRGN